MPCFGTLALKRRRLRTCRGVCCFLGAVLGLVVPAGVAHGESGEGPVPSDARLRLPEAYSGVAVGTNRHLNPSGGPADRVEFEIASGWSTSTRALYRPGFGFVPATYEHGTPEATWTYDVGTRQAQRGSRFAEEGTLSMELFLSPIAVLRGLRTAVAKGGMLEERTETDPETGYRLLVLSHAPVRGGGLRTEFRFDMDADRLVEIRGWSAGGDLIFLKRFLEWTELGDGTHVPARIENEYYTSDDPLEIAYTIEQLAVVEGDGPPPLITLAADTTIIDRVEGVSKRTDGTVVGPVSQTGGQPGGPGATRASWLVRNWLLAIGVALVVVAGAVWRFRSRSGAGA